MIRLPGGGALVDLSDRTKLRVTGADRLRYLNGQISNDLRKASEAAAIHACVLSAKGKVNADVYIIGDDESFLIDTDEEMRDQLAARLERYIIADDVLIEDVSEKFALFHVFDANAPALPQTAKSVVSERFGRAGTDLWLDRAEHAAARQELATTLSVYDAAQAETLRIERGIPRWGFELTEEIIPTEANLEAGAIDFSKGCYIGQEVISRIKMSGQTNKRLCGLVCLDDGFVETEMRLVTLAEGKDVGWITSTTRSARLGKQIALGFIKRGFQAVGLRLQARGTEASAVSAELEVVPLPFIGS